MERRFDCLVEFDEQSRNWPIQALLTEPRQQIVRSFTWSCETWLDQLKEGACVGFGFAHEQAARPKVHSVTPDDALRWYHRAQDLDGYDFTDGTTVIAGAKALKEEGLILEYRWGFGLTDTLLALSHHGPVVFGLNWHEGMWDPDKDGRIHATGQIVGRHCILGRAVSLPRQAVLFHNSWGKDWGVKGCAWIGFSELSALLHADGEACIPVVRG
jgi:hypothetical protein